jgi:hypothetical protein
VGAGGDGNNGAEQSDEFQAEETVTGADIRQIERASIRSFMERHKGYLIGRVLDYGAGKQPYSDLVEGDYVPWDKGGEQLTGKFNAIMCNQVLEYIGDPRSVLEDFYLLLGFSGFLVMTYPTCWDEVESDDYWRFTKAGMERLLPSSMFEILVHERRAQISYEGFAFPLGYGLVAQKR